MKSLTGEMPVKTPTVPANWTVLKTVFPPFWKSTLIVIGRNNSAMLQVFPLKSHLVPYSSKLKYQSHCKQTF